MGDRDLHGQMTRGAGGGGRAELSESSEEIGELETEPDRPLFPPTLIPSSRLSALTHGYR
ncbi:hypothetical protein BRD56_02325 [Thermoplasmatales archaeon SW_10_69_26]|nr:MAG: hypothetical protein BRD56_02325 [Thermoplasmatales archaeon SW_10_69_26]